MMDYIRSLTDPTSMVGLIASVIVLVSMCFNTKSRNGELLMRSVNLIGSIVSITYGFMLGPSLGAGVILLNGALVFVNAYYLIECVRRK